MNKSGRRLRQLECPIAGSIGHRVALKHAVKKDNPRVVWWQLRCHDGDRVSAGASHKGRGGDKAAKVCDVRVQKDITPCHASACPACEDTLCDSRSRREGNKGGGCAVGVGRQAFVDTTGDGNGFTRLKPLAYQRYAAAGSGLKRRAIEEHPCRVVISDRRRTGIGALFGKSEVLETAPPWQGGGNMIVDVTFEKTIYATAPAPEKELWLF